MSGLLVDLFAGGGGASLGLQAALGRSVVVAGEPERVYVSDGVSTLYYAKRTYRLEWGALR